MQRYFHLANSRKLSPEDFPMTLNTNGFVNFHLRYLTSRHRQGGRLRPWTTDSYVSKSYASSGSYPICHYVTHFVLSLTTLSTYELTPIPLLAPFKRNRCWRCNYESPSNISSTFRNTFRAPRQNWQSLKDQSGWWEQMDRQVAL